MKRTMVLAGLALALGGPAAAQRAGLSAAPERTPHVRITARIVVLDRAAFTRAGLDYLVLGNDRVRVEERGRRSRGARIALGTHGITAFVAAAHASRLVHSESTQQVLTRSGAEAIVSSSDLTVGRHSVRTRGPSLAVLPEVLADGSVHLRVSARLEDAVRSGWGYGVDGSPAAVDTEIVAGDGEEVLLASSSAVERTRESGLLTWGTGEEGRDVLVLLTARAVSR